jgi:allantoin racemase
VGICTWLEVATPELKINHLYEIGYSMNELEMNKKRILYINPVGTSLFDDSMLEILTEAKNPETEVEVTSLKRGPSHVEYHYYESIVLADVLHTVKNAENNGYDAVILGCFYDLGLEQSREISERMIITAPAESCMLLACSLGSSFSIIVGRRKWIPQMMSNVVRYGLKDRLASFKSLELGVLDFQRNKELTEKRQIEAAREAIERDGAEVIILGCTAEFGFWEVLQKKFKVPVLDPVITPLKYAEHLVTLRDAFGWSHSKIGGYESPPIDEIKKWHIGRDYNTKVWDSTAVTKGREQRRRPRHFSES